MKLKLITITIFKHSLPKDINTYQVGKILRNISDELDGV